MPGIGTNTRAGAASLVGEAMVVCIMLCSDDARGSRHIEGRSGDTRGHRD